VSVPGYREDATCPKCRTFTQQRIVRRGERQCLNCKTEFRLKDVERIRGGKIIRPKP
jgi:hypothetical protein